MPLPFLSTEVRPVEAFADKRSRDEGRGRASNRHRDGPGASSVHRTQLNRAAAQCGASGIVEGDRFCSVSEECKSSGKFIATDPPNVTSLELMAALE